MGQDFPYNPKEDPVIIDFLSRLRDALGDHLKGAVLFGSRARGDALRDSDYDVLVLVDEPSLKIEKDVSFISYMMMEVHEELFVAFVESESRFRI